MQPLARFVSPLASAPGLGWLAAGAAWVVLLAGWSLGWPLVVDHHGLLAHGPPRLGDLLLFLLVWQLMVVAMMLPTTMPMVGLFGRTSRNRPDAAGAMPVFLGAYFVVWTTFALAALAADAGLHVLIHRVPWLSQRDGLVQGAVLLGAGAFQFTALKYRCLDACRNPMQFIFQYYERGIGGAWRFGVRHAAFCLGCCWALMLVMFAVGSQSMAWMVGLTGVMIVEKTSPVGRRLVPYVGFAMIAFGIVSLLGTLTV